MAIRDKKSFDNVHAMKALLALGAMSVHTHTFDAKVCRRKELRFVTAVKAVLAKPLCQPYLCAALPSI